MGAEALSSRAIIGDLARALEETSEAEWVAPWTFFNSTANQPTETYKFLGITANMRKWVGPRNAKGLLDFGVPVTSDEYEDTLELKRRELRLDKTGQVQQAIRNLAIGAGRHWQQLLSPLVDNGAASVATYGAGATYDGADFYGSGHRGSQSNAITSPAVAPATPTSEEFMNGVLAGVQALYSFTDEQGQPINEGLSAIHVMAPIKYWALLSKVLNQGTVVVPTSNNVAENFINRVGGLTFAGDSNVRLAGFNSGNKIAVTRADGGAALIRQEEEGLTIEAIAEGSEEEIKNRRHIYGVRATRGVGFGFWEHSVQVAFATP